MAPSTSPRRSRQDSSADHPRKRRKVANSPRVGRQQTAVRRKKACQTCRLRKIKCDAARPVCSLCKTTGAACEYLEDEDERHGSLTLESATEILCKRLDTIQSLLGAHLDRDQLRDGTSSEFESSQDFVRIPCQKTSADVILTWPVFEGLYPSNALVNVLFTPDHDEHLESFSSEIVKCTNHEDAIALTDSFLKNVHTKNPILDVELLLEQAQYTASNGFQQDGHTCLIFLACALGSIAKPFNIAMLHNRLRTCDSSIEAQRSGLEQGEAYFALARARLGAMNATFIGIQCHFYAGVYLMYTLRPLQSWKYFINASTLYQLYEKMNYGPNGRDSEHRGSFSSQYYSAGDKQKRIEQSLYWSCFKSESEFRIELPLPLTEIGSHHHPQMFPTPPSPLGMNLYHPKMKRGSTSSVEPATGATSLSRSNSATSRLNAKVYNEDESWYYYLTEVALRRIGNRVVNTFFREDPLDWLAVRPLLRIALEFDTQVSSWSAHLPPAMQHWETTSSIRAPNQRLLENGNSNHVSQELSWAIDNRLLEIRSWLYQPFLFYLIHHKHEPGACDVCPDKDGQFSIPPAACLAAENSVLRLTNCAETHLHDESAALQHLVAAGIECNLTILENRSLPHRHHGLWFDLRSLMSASLILLALIRSGYGSWIPGGVEALWGEQMQEMGINAPIEGQFGHALTQFDFWSPESSDMVQHRQALEGVIRYVRSLFRS